MSHRCFWSVSSAVTLFLLASSVFAHSSELLPAGIGNDTDQLQAVLSKCSYPSKPCDIRLGAGVFYTDVLLAKGFRGSITGHGQGRTVIRPILTKPLHSTRNPFFAEPTIAEPYPVLLHFADGGNISLSGFTMDFPTGMTVSPYNHYLLDPPDNLDITDYLQAAIMVEGDHTAELQMDHVTVIGRDLDNYWGSNVASAVRFEGKLRFSGTVDSYEDRTRKLQHGRMVGHDNHFIRTGNGFWVEDTNNTHGALFANDIDARVYGVNMTNLGNSHFQTLRNRIKAEIEGIVVFQTPERPPEESSRYVIAQNRISVNERGLSIAGGANDAIATYDFAVGQEGLTETMEADVDIWGNEITLGVNVLDGIEIFSDGPGDVRVVSNRIHGVPVDSGIWVEFSEGTFIAANDLRAIDPPDGDISLRDTSRECIVIEPADTIQDQGKDNHVIAGSVISQSNAARATAKASQGMQSRSRARWKPGSDGGAR